MEQTHLLPHHQRDMCHHPIPKGFLVLHQCQEGRCCARHVWGQGGLQWSKSTPLSFMRGEKTENDTIKT